MENPKTLNRLKAVLQTQVKQTSGLQSNLARFLLPSVSGVLNTSQLDLQTLAKISKLLKVNIRELLVTQNF